MRRLARSKPIAAPDLPADTDTARAVRAFMARLKGKYPTVECRLFGSRARGGYRSDSDADLAVILKGETGPRFKVAGEMAAIAFDVMQQILIDPLPLWEGELARPETFSNPALIENIKRDGRRI